MAASEMKLAINPLSSNITKYFLSVFDHFVGLALTGIRIFKHILASFLLSWFTADLVTFTEEILNEKHSM